MKSSKFYSFLFKNIVVGFNLKSAAIFLLIISTILLSCVPQSSGGKKRSSKSTGLTDDNSIPNPTPLSENINFIQHGITKYTTAFPATKDFSDTMLLRGNGINNYLNNTAYSNTNLCIVARYPNINKSLILSAIPSFFPNYTTGAREYYYRIHANDTQAVQSICQTAGMITKILTDNPTDSIVYSFSDLCPSCSYLLGSSSLKIYSTGGTLNTAISVDHLHINVSGSSSSSPTTSCTSAQECLQQGFDCCLDGQCVEDSSTRNGVDTNSDDYLIAAAQILQNHSLYTNYPEYFYVCPINSNIPTPTATPTVNPQLAAQKLLTKLGELRACITPGDDELAICTIEYPNASTTIGTSGASFSAALDDRNFKNINSNLPDNSIVEIQYAGTTLYQADPTNYSLDLKSLDGDISRFTIPEPIKEVSTFITPSPTLLNGKYFKLYSRNGLYYVWYNVDSSGSVAPGAPAIRVDVYSFDSAADVARKTANAIGASNDFTSSYSGTRVYVTHSSLGSGDVTDISDFNSGITSVSVTTQGDNLDGKYFSLTGNSGSYFVWYTVDGSATPAPAGVGTAINVSILSTDTPAQIATKTAAAINIYADFSASASAAAVIITNQSVGVATNITNNTAGIFDIIALTATNGPFIDDNDNFTQAQSLIIRTQNSISATEDSLKIKYKIDGSCVRVNSALVKCTKHYVHGQESVINPQVSDHSLSSTTYTLPTFADTSLQVITKVDGTSIPRDDSGATTWKLSSNNVIFDGKTIYDGQKVEITYFVTDSSYVNNLMISKEIAQNEIKTYCSCPDLNCSLTPVKEVINGIETTVEYSCVYPTPNLPAPPMQQTVYVNSKTAPHRFFATDGGVHDTDYTSYTQEGEEFKYTDNNPLRPNNQSSYKGFNEIYGSFKSGANYAQPAKRVDITKNKIYDIFVDSGNFSSCTTCGYDYYSGTQKIFPSNFLDYGGGFLPDMVETSKMENKSIYRADDIIFGRACFVPATMIPWTHKANNNVQYQRLNRLQAQHFLFANGYQRDWYGFDYGSLIGSFDGVKWFSVGNQRRITAKGNKLFLAINAYFGDVTVQNSFSVTINEVTQLAGGATIEHDFDSDGAECQRAHTCNTDRDCFNQLGYDYICENVSSIKSYWPIFSVDAEEISGTTELKSIANLVGGTHGFAKRCVYRGKGAPCHQNYSSETEVTSYTATATKSLHSCSSNNYCERLSTAGKFNDRITRYAKSPLNQNASSDVLTDSDIFGLGARILGRPFLFNGDQNATIATVDASTLPTQFSENNVDAICIPGKDSDYDNNNTLEGLNSSTPSTTNEYGDKVNNIGPIRTSNTASEGYYSQCSVTNDDGNLYRNISPSFTLAEDAVKYRAATQNLASSLLSIIEPSDSMNVFAEIISGIVTGKGIQDRSCLRAPGASCHTDFECAPSNFVAGKMAGLTYSDVSTTTSAQELEFWQEGLICANEKSKNNIAEYQLKNNRCCRETGKTITIYSDESNGNKEPLVTAQEIDTTNIAGLDLSLDSPIRYSRIATVYNKMKDVDTSADYPPLKTFVIDSAAPLANSMANKQYNTFNEIASRTCCSANWVRNFSDENGGGHRWEQGKLQEFDKGNFKCLNWEQRIGQATNWECTPTEALGTDCKMMNFITSEKDGYLKFFGRLELLGIPQIAIEDDLNYTQCRVDPTDQAVAGAVPVPGTLNSGASPEYNDGANNFFSANDINDNFDDSFGLKKVFSDKKVSCCLPAGEYHGTNISSEQCCTGFASGDHPGYCCLKDYTDLTVYLNRYVSSEARELSDSSFDASSGYITSKSMVAQIALQKGMCCSGNIASGRAISRLQIPGTIASDQKTTHFVSSDASYNNYDEDFNPASSFDAGVRWNDHVYCVPANFNGTLSD